MREPDFFIVGAPRCGTTALNNFLKAHPEIFIPPIKEMHYFGADLNSPSPFHRNRKKYLEQFEPAREEKRIGETSVWYLYSKKAPFEIKEFNPRASVIIMLRNPLDAIPSIHAKLLVIGVETIPDLEKALAAEEQRKQAARLPDGGYPPYPVFYRENANYAPHVKRYIEALGKQNVFTIVYDDFEADPARVYGKTLEFLGVDTSFAPPFEKVNPHRGVRSHRLNRLLRHPPRTALALRQMLIPKSVHVGKMLDRLNLTQKPRADIDPGLRARLQKELMPGVEQLSEMIGRDLTAWCR